MRRIAEQRIATGADVMREAEWIPGGYAVHERVQDTDQPTLEQLQEVIAEMAAHLASEGRPERGAYEASLVELMARHLVKDRWHPNSLSGSNLLRLRQALLIPAELAVLEQNLAAELYCACGRRLQGGSAVMLNSEGGIASLVCPRCVVPTWTVCSAKDCTEPVPLSSDARVAIEKATRGMKCQAHRGEAPQEGDRLPDPMVNQAVAHRGLDLELLHQLGARQAAPAVPRAPRVIVRP
jgi:hypothetical protein